MRGLAVPAGVPVRPLAVGVGTVVAAVMPGFLAASLAVRIDRDFAFGASSLGVAVAVYYLVSALGSTPAGRFVDRVGAARGVRWSVGLSAAAALAIAGLANATTHLLPLLVVAGAGNALAGPAAGLLLRRSLPAHQHGFAFGLMQAGGPLGAVGAGLALPLIAVPLGWRWAFVLVAVFAVGIALAARERPAGGGAAAGGAPPPQGSSAVAVRGAASVGGAAAVGGAAPPEARGAGARGSGGVLLLAVVAALASAAAMGMVSFLVLYAVDAGTTETFAGAVLAASSLAAAVGRVVVGSWADRGAGDPLRTVAALLVASIAGYGLLLTGSEAGIAVGALTIGALGWSWPGTLSLAVVRRSEHAPAWGVGVMMTGLFGGAMAGPLVVGQLADRGAFAGVWLLCAGIAAAAAATAAWAASAGRPQPLFDDCTSSAPKTASRGGGSA